jgi:uncharacterized damage-inducible protein DinB
MIPGRLPDYLRWANQRALDSMQTAPNLDPRAWEIATHMLQAEWLWLERLQGRVCNISWPKEAHPDELPVAVERNAAAYAEFLTRLGDSNPIVTYTNSKGESFTNVARDILAHVFAHGAYHRGQIAALVKRGGGTPAMTDYIFFLRDQK